MQGYIHSLQSLGTVDGPGIRAVVFASGCPLRCIYCHNPDTWNMTDGTLTKADELAQKILKLKPFLKNGGVTFSGGEPLMQADFFCELAQLLKKEGLHIALDTSGCIYNDSAEKLIDLCDMVLVMSVEPGFGGQKFMPQALEKLSKLKAEIDRRGLNIDLEVDGGINAETAPLAVKSGANVLVAGSYIFSAEDMAEKVKEIKSL